MKVVDAEWQIPPPVLSLEEGEIHLWRVPRDLSSESLAAVTDTLSPDERARADRFRFPQDRNRFQAGRGLLRFVLGGYLHQKAQDVIFGYTDQGKPYLPSQSGARGIHFNVSHSDGVALFAVLRGHPVGVDIEYIRIDIEVASLAEFTFAKPEIAELFALPLSQQFEGFYAFWTRKEAYVKASGSGLLCPLKEFAVSLKDAEVLLCTEEGDLRGISSLRVVPLECGPGYAGALATTGQKWRIQQFAIRQVENHSSLAILPFRSTGEEEKGLIQCQFH